MFSKNSNDKSFKLTQNQIGKGSFGCVFIGETDEGIVAAKCEKKTKNKKSMTLLKEFTICKSFYLITNYIGLINTNNNLEKDIKLLKDENKNIKNKNNVDNTNKDNIKKYELKIKKNNSRIENIIDYEEIKIFNYITKNNMLLTPSEMNINFMLDYKCVPCILKYIECNKHNFLLMQLCGDNLDNFLENNILTERGKYFMALHLLNTMSCIHRCGVVHRDIKLSNIVLNNKLKENKKRKIEDENNKEEIENDIENNIENNIKENKEIYPIILDMGLSEKYYKIKSDKIVKENSTKGRSIIGTLRYISINIHEYYSPTINDDLISLCYVLVAIMVNKKLPWIGHKKDENRFKPEKHTFKNCKCGYHKNIVKKDTKTRNTIAEMKFHTPLNELTGKYTFLKKWISYLYSLKENQLPSYKTLYKELNREITHFKRDNDINELFFEYEEL